MAQHFHELIKNVTRHPSAQIRDLTLLSTREKQQLLATWNTTHADYPHAIGIHELFEQQALTFPESIAICFKNETLHYQKLNQYANGLAHELIKLGINQSSTVAICASPSIEMIVSALAILKVGAAYLPLDPHYPQTRLENIVEDSKIRLVLIQHAFLDKFSSINLNLDFFIFQENWQDTLIQENYNLHIPKLLDVFSFLIDKHRHPMYCTKRLPKRFQF